MARFTTVTTLDSSSVMHVCDAARLLAEASRSRSEGRLPMRWLGFWYLPRLLEQDGVSAWLAYVDEEPVGVGIAMQNARASLLGVVRDHGFSLIASLGALVAERPLNLGAALNTLFRLAFMPLFGKQVFAAAYVQPHARDAFSRMPGANTVEEELRARVSRFLLHKQDWPTPVRSFETARG